jgi:hypothetical protein
MLSICQIMWHLLKCEDFVLFYPRPVADNLYCLPEHKQFPNPASGNLNRCKYNFLQSPTQGSGHGFITMY